MKKSRLFLSYTLLFVFLIFFYSYIKKNLEILSIFKSISINHFLILLTFSFLNYILKSYINIILYSFSKVKLSFIQAFRIIARSTALNMSVPGNLGTGYKLHFLNKYHKLNFVENISINTAYAFYLNYLYLVIILICNFFDILKISKYKLQVNVILIFLLLLITLIFKFAGSSKLKIINSKFVKNIIFQILSGFRLFKENKIKTWNIIIISFLHLITTIIYYQFIFTIIGFNLNIGSIILFYCLSSFIGIVKLTPGNIGFLEFVLIVLENIHGLSIFQIISFSFVSRIISFLSLILFFIIDNFNKN